MSLSHSHFRPETHAQPATPRHFKSNHIIFTAQYQKQLYLVWLHYHSFLATIAIVTGFLLSPQRVKEVKVFNFLLISTGLHFSITAFAASQNAYVQFLCVCVKINWWKLVWKLIGEKLNVKIECETLHIHAIPCDPPHKCLMWKLKCDFFVTTQFPIYATRIHQIAENQWNGNYVWAHANISTNICIYMYKTAVVYTKGIHALTLCTNKATQWDYQHYLKSTYKGTCTRHVWVDVRKPVCVSMWARMLT